MDENKLKVLAAELAKGLKTEADLNQFFRMLTKLTVETALNAEVSEHLGHEKNAPKKLKGPQWLLVKTLLSDDGESELSTPRDRENTFEPQLPDAYYADGHPDLVPLRQRHDLPRNLRHVQGNVRYGRVSHADI